MRWLLALSSLGVAASSCGGVVEDLPAKDDSAGGGPGQSVPSNTAGAFCTTTKYDALAIEIPNRLREHVPCYGGEVTFYPYPPIDGWLVLGPQFDFYSECSGPNSLFQGLVRDALRDLSPSACQIRVTVTGGATDELRLLASSIDNAQCGSFPRPFSVTLDGLGSVLTADSSELTPQELDCVRSATQDLVLPCLATAKLCFRVLPLW